MSNYRFLAVLLLGVPACTVDAYPEDAEPVNQSEEELILDGLPTIPRPRPNLVAVAPDGKVKDKSQGWAYCDFDPEAGPGMFVVRVMNANFIAAPATWTKLSGENGVRYVYTPSIPAWETVELYVDFHDFAACTPDCGFTITVDAMNQVTESSEANDFVGWCIG